MRVFLISVILVIAILMLSTGCSQKTVYVDRVVEVKVPVPCKMKEVKPAVKGNNDAVTIADIVRERDELREANKGCI